MSKRSIAAHFDGQQILLDEEVSIRPHTRLLVTILDDDDSDRSDFAAIASAAFADSYDDEEVEYSEADLKR